MRSFPTLIIFLAGGLGSVCRYGLSSWGLPYFTQLTGMSFPWGTLLVNVLGCFAIGVIGALMKRFSIEEWLRLTMVVGFLGGFTTFSSFILEGAVLLELQQNSILKALAYITGSVILGLLMFWAGEWMANRYCSG
jgi:CrcB protein